MYKNIICTLLLLSTSAPSYADTPWQAENTTKKRSDIALYTRHIEGEPIKAFRGVMQIPNAALEVVAMLMDISAYPEWVYQCSLAKTQITEQQPRLIYMAFDGLWPAKGRDVVVDHRIQQQADGSVHIHAFNSPLEYSGTGKHLRIPSLNNHWFIRPLKDGWTEVEFQTQFRAGGKLPSWLLNVIVTMAPRKTLENMQHRLASGHYAINSTAELPFQTPEVAALRFDQPQTLVMGEQ